MQVAASGMLVLGCVVEVRDFELIVALPNGLRGSVAITDISDAYTSQLQQLASNDTAAADDVNRLPFWLFCIWSFLCGISVNCPRVGAGKVNK